MSQAFSEPKSIRTQLAEKSLCEVLFITTFRTDALNAVIVKLKKAEKTVSWLKVTEYLYSVFGVVVIVIPLSMGMGK